MMIWMLGIGLQKYVCATENKKFSSQDQTLWRTCEELCYLKLNHKIKILTWRSRPLLGFGEKLIFLLLNDKRVISGIMRLLDLLTNE